jgi:wyosine [tRNA(Phe)-imidazoG37] synthetase (radical SAM superfamily)
VRPRLLLADDSGRVFDHPELAAAVAFGDRLAPAAGLVPLPDGGSLQALPGWAPIGYDEHSGQYVVVDTLEVGGKRIRPRAVGAVLPPGWTRAALPAGRRSPLAPTLPQWAYTAAALSNGKLAVAALHTERRRHWAPERYSTPDLAARVAARRAEAPRSRALRQLETCALEYRCFTAQNLFYGRDEGALPASTSCNARCIGCISEQPRGGPTASHERMEEAPVWEDLAALGGRHLATATGHVMVSFGQGCEGEPLTRAAELERAIRAMRQSTARGSIHINTNGSLPKALDRLARAGLDSVRVSLNSANRELYEAYYLPQGYTFKDVERTLAVARKRKLYLALNLLTFPGVNDRAGEVDALIALIRRHRVDQIQTRPLAIDPLQYLDVAEGRGAGGEPLGLREMLRRVRKAAPWVVIGNFSRAKDER